MIVTNHTYDVIGSYVPTKEMGEAADSSMLRLQSSISARKKRKMEQKSSETLSFKTAKSRLSKENKDVSVRLLLR